MDTDAFIPFAFIKNKKVGVHVRADASGKASFEKVLLGRYTVDISADGYSGVMDFLLDVNGKESPQRVPIYLKRY
jgi:hypothetical protein